MPENRLETLSKDHGGIHIARLLEIRAENKTVTASLPVVLALTKKPSLCSYRCRAPLNPSCSHTEKIFRAKRTSLFVDHFADKISKHHRHHFAFPTTYIPVSEYMYVSDLLIDEPSRSENVAHYHKYLQAPKKPCQNNCPSSHEGLQYVLQSCTALQSFTYR